MKRLHIILFALILLPAGIFASPCIVPSAGINVDVALQESPIWYASLQVPIMWTNQGLVGFSLVPSFSFNTADFQGFLTAEGMFVFPLEENGKIRLLLHSGIGLGGYRHSGRSEILPQLTCGTTLQIHRFFIRLSAEAMIMTKYYRNVDTFGTVLVGYGLESAKSQ